MTPRRQRPAGRSLARKVGTRRPKKTILVFCEGTRSEPEYLQALKREPAVRDAAAVEIRIATGRGGAVPAILVRRAVDERQQASGDNNEIDEFWCVFDVEWPVNHPNLKATLDLAQENGIHVAVSNPCFELWLILHFQDCGSWLDNDAARRLRRDCDGQGDKGLDGATYMPLRRRAAERARKLERRHTKNGTVFPDNNPSSGMHLLLASVEDPPSPLRFKTEVSG